jgi:hypothetical protein
MRAIVQTKLNPAYPNELCIGNADVKIPIRVDVPPDSVKAAHRCAAKRVQPAIAAPPKLHPDGHGLQQTTQAHAHHITLSTVGESAQGIP